MTGNHSFAEQYLREAIEVAGKLDAASIESAAVLLNRTRTSGGRLFIIGVGGSAATASHAVNDFRKIAGIETYSPVDNVAELTARANDDGWSTIFERWLQTSRLRQNDTLLVLSVGGGNLEKNVSPNIVAAVKYAKSAGATVIGIVGRDGGFTATMADVVVLIPTVNAAHITPHTESFHSLVLHLLVSHPAVKTEVTKWESMTAAHTRRAVFLDRDGVINRALIRNGRPYPPASQAELEILPDVPASLRKLRERGFMLIVVTNQPDVARGTQSQEAVEKMNQSLTSRLPLDDVLVCYHSDEDGCQCRKPRPGLLVQAAERYQIDLSRSFMIGDRWRDVEAGQNAGCTTILINNSYDERQPARSPDFRANSMDQAVSWIFSQEPEQRSVPLSARTQP